MVLDFSTWCWVFPVTLDLEAHMPQHIMITPPSAFG